MTRLARTAQIFLLATTAVCLPVLARPQILSDKPPITEGSVLDLAKGGNTIFMAGDFTYVGPPTGAGVVLDGTTGAVTASFQKAGFTAVAPDGSGGWYVGRYGFAAHLLPDLSMDPSWTVTIASEVMAGRGAFVRAIVVQGSTVYIGGQYDYINGVKRGPLAAVNAATGALLSFNSNNQFTATWNIDALAISGSTLFVGGEFTSIGGQARTNLAALDATTGSALPAWVANTDASSGREVRCLLVDGSNLYVGGDFVGLGGLPRNRLARVDVSTGAVAAWNPNSNGAVRALALQATTVYAGGSFTAIGGAFRNRIAALSTASNSALSWDPNADNDVNAMALIGSTLYVGGNFKNVGGQVRWRAAALDATTGLATSWKANTSGDVSSVFPRGTNVIMSGGSSFGGEPRNYLAAFDATTNALLPWNPNASAPVFCLSTDGATVYLGGTFTQVGGANRTYLAAVSATTGLPTAWSPSATGVSFPYPRDLLLSGSTLYVGGDFTGISGTSRPHLAAFDLPAGTLNAWNPSADGNVQVIFPYGQDLYVGGTFSSVGGAPRVALAALDPTTGLARPWDAGADQGPVTGIATDGASLFVCGQFTAIGGFFRRSLAALDFATASATAFEPNPTTPPRNLAVYGNLFTVFDTNTEVTIGGQTRRGLAELDLPSGSATSWAPPIVGLSSSGGDPVLIDGSTLYIGGSFDVIDPTWGAIRRGVLAVDLSSRTGVEDGRTAQGLDVAVWPNPAPARVHLRLALRRDSRIRASVHDLQGRQVSLIADRWLPAGVHDLAWEPSARDRHAGIRFLRVEGAGGLVLRRLVMLP